MLVRDTGMRRGLHLRDGDSERGSGMQEETRTRFGRDTNEKGRLQGHYLAEEATVGAQPSSGGEGFY